MNNLDKAYQNLLKDILENGIEKEDRTGTGTISVFGRQIRHKMSEGFPLLTTKKMAWKSIVTELLWFLRGDTNIKFLVDNGCHIWDGDAYKRYKNVYEIESRESTYALEELHMLSDLTKDEFIERIKTSDEFAKKWGELGPIYGAQWRKWKRYRKVEDKPHNETLHIIDYVDQIANLIKDLKENPDSRRLMVNAWDVAVLDEMVLPPCHYGFQVYTRKLSKEEKYRIWFSKNYETGMEYDSTQEPDYENPYYASIPDRAISLMWAQRSVDTFLGLPFNIASYGLLLHILAKVTGMWPDELIGNLGDVHLYSNHVDQAKEQISREPFPLPFININTEFWLTESGECGEGPLSASGFISALANPHFSSCLIEEDIQLGKYVSHPPIKAPLSN
jgi:thymidylate synthase